MQTLLNLKAEQQLALNKAEAAMRVAEAAGRAMNESETRQYDTAMAEFRSLGKAVQERTAADSLSRFNPLALISGGGQQPFANTRAFGAPGPDPRTRGADYGTSFYHFIASKGKRQDETLMAGFDGSDGFLVPGSEAYTRQRAANGMPVLEAAGMYEGTGGSSGSAGGDVISIPTAQNMLVPLGLPDMGIFNASTVIPTVTDVKIPQQTAFGGSALKSESGSTINTFAETDPTLGQITLASWMIGNLRLASWELIQDAPVFQQFITDDLLKSQQIFESSLFASGTGSNQPQGLFGNTGTGTASAYQLVGTAATDAMTLINSLYDVQGTLKEVYQPNASWIMSRATAMAIRRAQTQSNLFIPVVRMLDDGTTVILDRPVYYDANAPALPTATTAGVIPILYGDFKQGYVIGVRGGGGINVKVLDQPWASQGQLGILAYRRVDGRVRLAEAVQQVKVSHS